MQYPNYVNHDHPGMYALQHHINSSVLGYKTASSSETENPNYHVGQEDDGSGLEFRGAVNVPTPPVQDHPCGSTRPGLPQRGRGH